MVSTSCTLSHIATHNSNINEKQKITKKKKLTTKALFFLILGLQIFFQSIKVGGGKK